ncbi:hypothetical protein YC2023_029797 [Brassica napus]
MAISHVQPLLLFVSLFFLPAALGTAIEFSNCHRPLFTGVVNITKVEIIPYPIKYNDNPIFKITGVTSRDLAGRSFHVAFGRRGSIGTLWIQYYYDICEVTKCPIEPGPFVLTLANLNFAQSNYRSGEYAVELGLDDTSLPSPDMCAFFYFHANAMAEFQNVPITNGVNVSKVELFPFNATVNDNPVFRITAVTRMFILMMFKFQVSTQPFPVYFFLDKYIWSDQPKASHLLQRYQHSASMVLEGESELLQSSRRGYELCDCTNHCPVAPGGFELVFPHPYWRYKIKPVKRSVLTKTLVYLLDDTKRIQTM